MSARAINPRGRLAEAMALWSSGKRAQAERVCLAQVKAFPSDLDAARLLSEMYATASTEGGAASRAEAAIDACHRVAELAPRDAANYRRLAQLLSQCGRLSEAVPILERALALEPDNARALNNLGNALSGLGRPEQAIAWLERRSRCSLTTRSPTITWALPRRDSAARNKPSRATAKRWLISTHFPRRG